MANVNNPHGLRPIMRDFQGGNSQVNPYTKAAAYAQAIYKWDPVTLLAGVLNGPASGITPGTTRYRGVSLNWSVASVLTTHLIVDSPGAIFEVQGDGSGSGGNVISAATMGFKANLNVASVAGGGVTRDNSGVQLTESTIATTSSLDVHIMQLVGGPGLSQTGLNPGSPDNAYGVNARVEVRFNKHLENPEVTAT